MAKKKVNKRRKKKEEIVDTPCIFCVDKMIPDYKNYEFLANFVSDRARIVGKARTGVCSKHQRRLTREIKRARHLGLLPFAPTL